MSESNLFPRRQFLSAAAMSLAAGLTGSARARTKNSAGNLPVEGDLPSLKHANGWLNSQPLDIAQLRGKVVLVNFWTYTCINWLRTLPYVRAWDEKYRSEGLAVIGVHTPEFGFEHDIDNVRLAAKEMNVNYPIAIDNDYAIWQSFENEYWPALYFVDAKGRIRHHKFGEGEYERSEQVIQELLREAGRPEIEDRFVNVDARGIESAADWTNLRSPENYVGRERTQNFAPSRRGSCYVVPARLKLNHWALAGDWAINKRAIVLNEGRGSIAYRFHARDLHLVMGPAAPEKAVRFCVTIDGQAPGPAHGTDIDAQGYGTLAESRLYQLIRQPKDIADRQFAIEFFGRGVQAFAFTFG